jgi:hypothetical protein
MVLSQLNLMSMQYWCERLNIGLLADFLPAALKSRPRFSRI